MVGKNRIVFVASLDVSTLSPDLTSTCPETSLIIVFVLLPLEGTVKEMESKRNVLFSWSVISGGEEVLFKLRL